VSLRACLLLRGLMWLDDGWIISAPQTRIEVDSPIINVDSSGPGGGPSTPQQVDEHEPSPPPPPPPPPPPLPPPSPQHPPLENGEKEHTSEDKPKVRGMFAGNDLYWCR